MAETHETIAVRVRRHLGLPESATVALQPLVDVILRRLCLDLAKEPHNRHWILTDPATTTVALSAGVADLSSLITSPRIILEGLCYGEIYPPSGYTSTLPFHLVEHSGQGQLAGAYDGIQYDAWLVGSSLHTRGEDTLVGTISLAVPYWPTIAQLNGSLTDRLVLHPDWIKHG